MDKSGRLLSLDALRGATIAAMIVVNTPGSWSAIYPPLRHADWHGLTPTDLVFPFFLFIVGVSIALAYGKTLNAGADLRPVRRKILIRSAKIFAVGVFLNLWPEFAFDEIRIAGVLQRIAIVFAVAALLFVHLRWRALAGITAAILLGYWGLLTLVPVPRDGVNAQALASGQIERAHGTIVNVDITARNNGAIAPNLEPGTNLAAWFDRKFLPGSFYESTWDPEGWLSTVPSLATTLLGILTGVLLGKRTVPRARFLALAGGGLGCLVVGYGWSLTFPLNKNLWTSSFVLVSAGWSLLAFALTMGWVEGRGQTRWLFPGLVFGANAITAYVLAGMLTTITHRDWLMGFSPVDYFMNTLDLLGFSPELASLCFALTYTGMIFVPVWMLYQRRIYIRL